MQSESLLRLNTVLQKTGLSRAALYQRIKDGTFCAPVHIGARAVAWPESFVNSWIQDRIAEAKAKRQAA